MRDSTNIVVLQNFLQRHRSDTVYAALAQDRIAALERQKLALNKQKAEEDAARPTALTQKPPLLAPNEPFPDKVPISPQVLRFTEGSTFFSNAPRVKSIEYSADEYAPNSKGQRTGIVLNKLKWLRAGIIYEENETQQQGGGRNYWNRTMTVSAGNGRIELGHASEGSAQVVGQNKVQTRDVGQATTIESVTGQLFPMVIGGKYGFQKTATTKNNFGVAAEFNERTLCEVTKKVDASIFHKNLTGAVFVHICTSQSKGASRVDKWSEVVRTVDYFFEDLGVFLFVHPKNPTDRDDGTNTVHLLQTITVSK